MTDIFNKAIERQKQGLKVYGEFSPETDKRDLFKEIEEEFLDVINYSYFQILKIRNIKERGKVL